jgi:hypothetical protein
MNNFCTACRGKLQSNYLRGAFKTMSGTSITTETAAAAGVKVDDEVLSIAKGQLRWEPWLQPT